MQVRVNAAKATLAVAPQQARQMLQAIADSQWQPQAGDAGMCLWNLDRGVFVPSRARMRSENSEFSRHERAGCS